MEARLTGFLLFFISYIFSKFSRQFVENTAIDFTVEEWPDLPEIQIHE